MKMSNLQRAADIADALPRLKEARALLSRADTLIRVEDMGAGVAVKLPRDTYANVIAIINATINRMEKEVTEL